MSNLCDILFSDQLVVCDLKKRCLGLSFFTASFLGKKKFVPHMLIDRFHFESVDQIVFQHKIRKN